MKFSIRPPAGRFAKEEIFLLSVLGTLFVTFIILVIVLIASERNRNTLLAEYEADRAASALFESYREASLPGFAQGAPAKPALPSNIAGFGVYDLGGQQLEAIGDAPQSIAAMLPRINPQLVHFDQRARTITLVRVLGAMPGEQRGQARFRGQFPPAGMLGMMGRFGGPQRFPFPERSSFPAYLYVKLSTRSFYATRNLLTLALVLVPVALGIAMAVVWSLFLRNRRYREKIESQEHLVHLGEIARTLSHEIKNPLSSIRLQTGIMRKVFDGESPRELELIEEETDRLTQLVERIGEFLRDPLGNPERIEIVSFLRDLVPRFDWSVERMDLPNEPVYIRFDRNRLRTVLENIMKNAAESGEGATEFSVHLEATKQRVEIRVVDRGSGIPEEIRGKIFDPFYTTKVKGSGIGLAISKRFIEAAQGSLSIENGREGGTEARIALKRVAPAPLGGEGE